MKKKNYLLLHSFTLFFFSTLTLPNHSFLVVANNKKHFLDPKSRLRCQRKKNKFFFHALECLPQSSRWYCFNIRTGIISNNFSSDKRRKEGKLLENPCRFLTTIFYQKSILHKKRRVKKIKKKTDAGSSSREKSTCHIIK
jgi:hypothetical protein